MGKRIVSAVSSAYVAYMRASTQTQKVFNCLPSDASWVTESWLIEAASGRTQSSRASVAQSIRALRNNGIVDMEISEEITESPFTRRFRRPLQLKGL